MRGKVTPVLVRSDTKHTLVECLVRLQLRGKKVISVAEFCEEIAV